jgi:hypothetical protein
MRNNRRPARKGANTDARASLNDIAAVLSNADPKAQGGGLCRAKESVSFMTRNGGRSPNTAMTTAVRTDSCIGLPPLRAFARSHS